MGLRVFLLLALVVLSVAFAVLDVLAQPQQQTRVRGTIDKIDGSLVTVRTREGSDVRIAISDKLDVVGLTKIELREIPSNAFVGVAALPQPDGSQKAISIHLFPEASRGFNEGSRPYDVRPNSTMTNGAIAARIARADGDVLTIKYKDGEKAVVVTADTSLVRFERGEFQELKPGSKIVATVQRGADGVNEAIRIIVGRGTVVPAM